MARYALSRADAEALVAHLKRLREERAPGVDEAALRIGTILPDRGRLAPAAGAMRAALAAYAETLNRAGGIHQRVLSDATSSTVRNRRAYRFSSSLSSAGLIRSMWSFLSG